MKLTTKGQVTIPVEIRQRLGLTPGSEVDFVLDTYGVRIIRRSPSNGAALVAKMQTAKTLMSTDEIMALTRDLGD